jgi:hypothetical protein
LFIAVIVINKTSCKLIVYCNARLGEDYGILGIGLDCSGKIKGFVFEQGAENMTGIPEGISGFDSIAKAIQG